MWQEGYRSAHGRSPSSARCRPAASVSYSPAAAIKLSSSKSLMALLCSFVLFKEVFYHCLYMSLWVGVFCLVFVWVCVVPHSLGTNWCWCKTGIFASCSHFTIMCQHMGCFLWRWACPAWTGHVLLLGETLVLSAADGACESPGQGGRMGLLILGISTAKCLQHWRAALLPAVPKICSAQGEGPWLQGDVSFSVLQFRVWCPLLMS